MPLPFCTRKNHPAYPHDLAKASSSPTAVSTTPNTFEVVRTEFFPVVQNSLPSSTEGSVEEKGPKRTGTERADQCIRNNVHRYLWASNAHKDAQRAGDKCGIPKTDTSGKCRVSVGFYKPQTSLSECCTILRFSTRLFHVGTMLSKFCAAPWHLSLKVNEYFFEKAAKVFKVG